MYLEIDTSGGWLLANYSKIEPYIGHMKRAAIDAFMGQQGWIPDYEYDDRYALWGVIPSWYRRPTEDGVGGGERIAVGNDSMAPTFDNIRARISAATDKWVGLPSGAGASSVRTSVGSVAVQFGAAASGGAAIADGEVAKSIDTISNTVVSNFRGSFKAPFLDKYDAQFAKVIGGTGAAAAILQTAYAAEEAIWPAAQQDAVDICESVRNAFRTKAKQSSDQVRDIALGVVAAVAGVVTIVASAGTAAPIVTMIGFAKTAASAVESLNKTIDISTDSYESIMASLESASSALNYVITEQEHSIRAMVSSTSALISFNFEAFNLDAYSLRDFSSDDTIAIEQSEADTVLLNMNRLLAVMASASTALSRQPSDDFLRRDSEVGLGRTGPYSQIIELHDVISRCLKSTHNEYERGRALLEATANDLFASEDGAKAVAEALLRELETMGLGS